MNYSQWTFSRTRAVLINSYEQFLSFWTAIYSPFLVPDFCALSSNGQSFLHVGVNVQKWVKLQITKYISCNIIDSLRCWFIPRDYQWCKHNWQMSHLLINDWIPRENSRKLFWGENFRKLRFCSYSRTFSPRNWGRGVFWQRDQRAIRESFLSVNLIFRQFVKISSLESFRLYVIHGVLQLHAAESKQQVPSNGQQTLI